MKAMRSMVLTAYCRQRITTVPRRKQAEGARLRLPGQQGIPHLGVQEERPIQSPDCPRPRSEGPVAAPVVVKDPESGSGEDCATPDNAHWKR